MLRVKVYPGNVLINEDGTITSQEYFESRVYAYDPFIEGKVVVDESGNIYKA